MSTKLDPADVLAYLNELGYRNITTLQLKEFMRDLKKLIKYELKHKELDKENVQPPSVPFSFKSHPTSVSHLAPTESSKAKQDVKKASIISVAIKKRPPTCFNHQTHIDPNQYACSDNIASRVNTENITIPSISTDHTASPKRPRSCDTRSSKPKSKVTFKGNELRPKASYIIPRAPVKPCKSDPVALYHKYLGEWKKHKLPGEDNHSRLRWAIRERLLGQTETLSAAPSLEQIARQRKVVNRI